MMKRSIWGLSVVLLLATMIAFPVSAQDDKPTRVATSQDGWSFYKLDFVVRELDDGKVVNSRNYSMLTRSNDWQQLRVGTRVPITDGDKKIIYSDIGLQVDCRIIEERGIDTPALITKAEITSLAEAPPGTAAPSAPFVRRIQMNTSALLTLGKPIVLSSADELNSKHRFQLEVTATRLR